MKLVKIFFHSYRSLVDVELQVNHNCIGFVGINESGKSNILSAIHVLGEETKLTKSDTPKMFKRDPSLTFGFELNDDEYRNIHNNCINQFKRYIPNFSNDIFSQKIVNYNICFSREENVEYRCFEFPGIKIDESLFILLPEKTTSKYQIMTKDGIKKLDDCFIITNEDYQLHIELEQKVDKLSEMINLLHQKEDELNNISKTNETEEKEDENNSVKIDEVKESPLHLSNTNLLKKEISDIKNNIQILSEDLKDFKTPNIIIDIEKKNTSFNLKIKEETAKKSELNSELKTLKEVQSLTQAQTEKKTDIEQQLIKMDQTIQKYKNDITENNKTIILLKEKISEKYTNNKEEFIKFIRESLTVDLFLLLPKVIFWTYSNKYLQDSEISLERLLQQKDLMDISRPLVNIFRISYKIDSIEDLKNKIHEAQKNNNERSRISDQLTRTINDFLKTIWEDYKHKIKITVEKDEMRVEIFDPDNYNASYYSLIERSQGCRTFISFLLTIGAEATKGVLKDSILLLDEPETHLHPTGVKFMLKELIKISNAKNNIVFFATHSMFMIDRNNFSRHVIVEKMKERTSIKYALSDRIGYFMQEEVLYNALNIEFDEFDSTGKINFVFEGYGDTVFFKNIYSSLQKKDIPFKLDDCVFHHGGGCDNIGKYLKNNPIRVGTKWYFILDSDNPAEDLIKNIRNKYKDNVNKEIFIFQYNCEKIEKAELEDLISDEIKFDIYKKVLKEINKDEEISKEQYLLWINGQFSFAEQFKVICKNLDIVEKDIKATFKENLNNLLELDSKEIKNNEELFKNKYSNYYKWFEGVISECKKNSEPKKEKDDPKKSP